MTPVAPLTLNEADGGAIPDIEVVLSGVPSGGLERLLTVTLMVDDSVDPLTSKSLEGVSTFLHGIENRSLEGHNQSSRMHEGS